MNPQQMIVERLRAIFSETFHIEPPAADFDLVENGILDSLQFAELLVQLEEHFGTRVRIDAIDLDDLRTLERIARLVRINGSPAGSSGGRAMA